MNDLGSIAHTLVHLLDQLRPPIGFSVARSDAFGVLVFPRCIVARVSQNAKD